MTEQHSGPLDDTLNWEQACRLMECSKSHLYNLINTGELPAFRSGKLRGVKVRRADCERYLKKWRERLEEKI